MPPRGGVTKYRNGQWRVDDRAGKFVGLFDKKEDADEALGDAERIRLGMQEAKDKKK